MIGRTHPMAKKSVFLRRIFSHIHILLNIKLHCPCYTVKTVVNFFHSLCGPGLWLRPSLTIGLHCNHSIRHCFVKFTVKKINAKILGPHRPAGPPHCGVCGVSSYATAQSSWPQVYTLSTGYQACYRQTWKNTTEPTDYNAPRTIILSATQRHHKPDNI